MMLRDIYSELLLLRVIEEESDPRLGGFCQSTVAQIAAKTKAGAESARRLLARLAERGEIETINKRAYVTARRITARGVERRNEEMKRLFGDLL